MKMMSFKNLNFRKKISIVFVSLIMLLMGLVGWVGYLNIGKVYQINRVLYENEVIPLTELLGIIRMTDQVKIKVFEHIAEQGEENMLLLDEEIKDLLMDIDGLASAYILNRDREEERERIDKFLTSWPVYERNIKNIIADSRANRKEEALTLAVGKAMDSFKNAEMNLVGGMIAHRRNVDMAAEEAEGIYHTTVRSLFVFIISGVILAIVVSLYFAIKISSPLLRLKEAAQKVSEGDLTQSVGIEGKDEAGVLAQAFDRMIREMRKMVEGEKEARGLLEKTINHYVEYLEKVAGADLRERIHVESNGALGVLGNQINSMRDRLYELVERIQETSHQVTSSVNEIFVSTTQQLQSAQEQSAGAQQIISTVNQISSTSSELAQSAKSVIAMAQKASTESQKGAEALSSTIEGIERIKSSNKSTAEKLGVLNEQAERIGKVVTTIMNVADQTNLLSLNAAIEAAKAGDHGKGFAVVAQEIRRLADQTQVASQEINEVIGDVQEAVGAAVMSMEKASEDIRVGSVEIVNAGDIFAEVISGVQEGLPRIEEVGMGVDQQAEASIQMAAALKDLEERGYQVRDASEQTNDSANSLNSVVMQLREAVSTFRVS